MMTTQPDLKSLWWEVVIDGSSSKKGSEGRVVVTNLEGFKLYYALIYGFYPTNNEDEYEVFIACLKYVRVCTDQLIQCQELVFVALASFQAHYVEDIARSENVDVDIPS